MLSGGPSPGAPRPPPLPYGALRKPHESRPARRLGRRKTARAGRPSAAVRLRRSTSTAEMLSTLLVGASERQVRRELVCGCRLLLSGGGSVGGEEAGGHRLSRELVHDGSRRGRDRDGDVLLQRAVARGGIRGALLPALPHNPAPRAPEGPQRARMVVPAGESCGVDVLGPGVPVAGVGLVRGARAAA